MTRSLSLPPAVSRREFLVAAAALAAGCRHRPYRQGDFSRPASSPVAILPAASYDLDFADLIGRGLAELGTDVTGLRVLLKPNLVEYEPGTVINTHPNVVVGAAIALKRAGAREIIVGEGPGHRRDLEYLATSTGLFEHLRDERLSFVDLNHDDVRSVALKSSFTEMADLMLPASVVDVDLVVSMPKLKTHHWTGITCSMKNLFGVVPGAVYGWPKNLLHYRGIENSILDINTTVRARLAIVDAVIGMEGDGPIMGRPKEVGAVVMGQDLVAVDATAARLMRLRPERVKHLAMAGEFLGNIEAPKIEMRGEPVERFATPFDVLDDFKHLRAEA
jgi:uncharacterized protein (DUF362 family)